MTVSETIEVLLEDLNGLSIAKPPPGPAAPKFFVKADQMVETGDTGNFVVVNHQCIGDSIVDCLNQLKTQVSAANGFKKKERSPILTRNGGRE